MEKTKPRPRIGVDFHVVDGIYQGSRSHVLELFARVIRICPDIDFFLFLDNVNALQEISKDFSLPNVHLVHMPYSNSIIRLCIQLPILQIKYKLNILHTQYISPVPSFCKTIITLHDILFESHPQYFSKLFNFRSNHIARSPKPTSRCHRRSSPIMASSNNEIMIIIESIIHSFYLI